jgi:hypothetical protein
MVFAMGLSLTQNILLPVDTKYYLELCGRTGLRTLAEEKLNKPLLSVLH